MDRRELVEDAVDLVEVVELEEVMRDASGRVALMVLADILLLMVEVVGCWWKLMVEGVRCCWRMFGIDERLVMIALGRWSCCCCVGWNEQRSTSSTGSYILSTSTRLDHRCTQHRRVDRQPRMHGLIPRT